MLFHLRRICKELLLRYQALDELLAAAGVAEAKAVLNRCEEYLTGRRPFRFDEGAARREEEAAARRKREAEQRKEFERRMRRKAKREGKEEDHYLKQGLEPPSAQQVAQAKGMAPAERMAWWRERFGQHCLAFHVEGRCARDRACAFLHLEVARPKEDNPSWLDEDLAARKAG